MSWDFWPFDISSPALEILRMQRYYEHPYPRWASPQRTAQLCPVCGGRGMVQAGFYSGGGFTHSTAPEKCRTCGGSGMVVV